MNWYDVLAKYAKRVAEDIGEPMTDDEIRALILRSIERDEAEERRWKALQASYENFTIETAAKMIAAAAAIQKAHDDSGIGPYVPPDDEGSDT